MVVVLSLSVHSASEVRIIWGVGSADDEIYTTNTVIKWTKKRAGRYVRLIVTNVRMELR